MEGVFEGGGEGFVVALPVSVFCLGRGGEGRGGYDLTVMRGLTVTSPGISEG